MGKQKYFSLTRSFIIVTVAATIMRCVTQPTTAEMLIQHATNVNEQSTHSNIVLLLHLQMIVQCKLSKLWIYDMKTQKSRQLRLQFLRTRRSLQKYLLLRTAIVYSFSPVWMHMKPQVSILHRQLYTSIKFIKLQTVCTYFATYLTNREQNAYILGQNKTFCLWNHLLDKQKKCA